jgi:methylenetetrahydrofolate dehydrogenase (NADP+)/methenyltetrahydrofolate cyclohydrolase
METRLLDGKKVAAQIKSELSQEIRTLRAGDVIPGLATVLVGGNPASRFYVASKIRACRELGMHSEAVELPEETTTEELLAVVNRLNESDRIDAILVQMPLPSHIDTQRTLLAVRPDKDVDGFHPVNTGRLCAGNPGLVPCTPQGIMELLFRERIPLRGAEAVVVGRSNIVGKPMFFLLLQEHATVTVCHSRTRDLPRVCRRADILIAAVGRPALLTRDYIKQGAVVVDVGVNLLRDRKEVLRLFGDGSRKLTAFDKRGSVLVGDVHPQASPGWAAAVTPVPGGVGPLTIALLMKNTVRACRQRRGKVGALSQ